MSPSTVPILSPCTGICHLDDAGLCEGCRRTGGEIAAWSSMDDEERRRIMDEVLPRRGSDPR
ncbi:MAG: DUF1289 domain-containing protein [Xanthomonadales bacterium]|nr:DUF1289 domain-containing protein [Xanthomonadales bacterium]